MTQEVKLNHEYICRYYKGSPLFKMKCIRITEKHLLMQFENLSTRWYSKKEDYDFIIEEEISPYNTY